MSTFAAIVLLLAVVYVVILGVTWRRKRDAVVKPEPTAVPNYASYMAEMIQSDLEDELDARQTAWKIRQVQRRERGLPYSMELPPQV